ncbi:hypothetical protein E0I00_23450, partial [Pseudomonas syringae pv. actinidiae]|nr:hypothetical protein [Pseudomonas syringae pv. actinidiae]
MSAKAVVQTQKMHRLHLPLREQAKRRPVRSHQSSWIPVGADLSANCREPVAKTVALVHQTQQSQQVSGPL